MPEQSRARSDLLRALDRSLIGIAGAALLLAVVEFAILPLDQPIGWILAGIPITFLVYVVAGLVAWHRRPSNRMGSLIVFAGFAVFLGGIGNTEVPVLIALSTVLATLALAAVIHLLLAFPKGRLSTRPARVLVAAGYFVTIVLEAPRYLLDPAGPFPPLAIADAPALAAAAADVQSAAGAVVMVSVAGVLIHRLVHAERSHRRVLIPVFTYGIAAVLFVPLSSIVLRGMLGLDATTLGVLQFAVVTGIPIAFALGVLRGGFERTAELEELGSWLGTDADRKDSLQDALARALGDRSLRLYLWEPEREQYVDERGRAAGVGADERRRGWVDIAVDDRTIGAIAYDASLVERERVETAGRIVTIAIEAQRLTVALLSSERALRRSRERIVDAADKERRRVARDLHDGLQMRLVLLALEARRVSAEPGVPEAAMERALRLRDDIGDAAGELRRLVHDLLPAALIERGLGAAAEDLADRMPIPTTVSLGIEDGTLPEAVESTAYFVVAEGLANIVKHSEATSAHVALDRDDGTLRIRVADDGKGGADPSAGTGLVGLADRVDVAGGTMRVHSVRGAGTSLTVELPCTS